MADPRVNKIIHAHVFNPRAALFKSMRNDRAELHTIGCSASDRCEVFARGQCIARLSLSSCRHGRAYTEQGPTPKAEKFSAWVQAANERAKGIGSLAMATRKLATVGDYVWLPYAHMGLTLNPGSFFAGDLFVPVVEFTVDLIVKLCAARPRALFGGELTDYQSKSVPLFVSHLSEMRPEMLAEAAAQSERIRAILAAQTKVGRKAKLHTLRPNVGTFSGGASPASWTWDGTHLTCTDTRAMPPFTPFGAVEMRIVPGPDAVVTITDNGQVTDSTIFED